MQTETTTSLSSGTPKGFGQLNGLRGIAALVVIISHSANLGFLPNIFGRGFGQMGVCLFFILSGFLMGHLYLVNNFSAQKFRQYAVKRAARVLPLFFFCLLIAALAYVLFDWRLYEIGSLQDILGNALLVHGTSVLWSIPVEIHFYIVFVFVWLALARGVRIVLLVGILILLQLITALLLVEFSSSKSFLPYWMHVFVFGILVSVAYQSYSSRFAGVTKSRYLNTLGWLVAFAVMFSLPELRRDFGMKVSVSFLDPISVGYPALVFVCALLSLGPFRFLDAKPMQWLGKVSFSLYLLHMPVLMVAKSFVAMEGTPFLGFLTVLLLTTLASGLTFNAIERPAQSWLRKVLLSNKSGPPSG